LAQVLQVVAQLDALVLVCLSLALGNTVQVQRINGVNLPGAGSTILPFITPAALLRAGRSASAARARGRLRLAVGALVADQSALGLGAVGRAVAFPVAQGFLADTLALRGWVGAFSVALGFFADGVALGARALLTVLDRAAYLALGLLAFDGALAATKFLATCATFRLFTDRFAHLVADGGVALPLALRVAVVALAGVFSTASGGGRVCLSVGAHNQERKDGGCNDGLHLLCVSVKDNFLLNYRVIIMLLH